jgi:hypothetical protein
VFKPGAKVDHGKIPVGVYLQHHRIVPGFNADDFILGM